MQLNVYKSKQLEDLSKFNISRMKKIFYPNLNKMIFAAIYMAACKIKNIYTWFLNIFLGES